MYIHECIHLIIRLPIHLNTPYVKHYIWIHRWIAMRYLPAFQENFHEHPNLRHQYKGTEQFRWYPMMVVFMIGLIGCFTYHMHVTLYDWEYWNRITLPETNSESRQKALSLALQGHHFMTCTSSAPEKSKDIRQNGEVWGWDEGCVPTRSGRECGMFFWSLFVADSRVFFLEIAVELGDVESSNWPQIH